MSLHFMIFFQLVALQCVAPLPITANRFSRQADSESALRELKKGLAVAGTVFMNTTESPFKNTINKDILKQLLVDISELMFYQNTISEIVDIDQGNYSIELIAVKIVLDEILKDACSLLQEVIKDKKFNCSQTQVNNLAAQISAQRAVNIASDILKDSDRIDTCQWIKCNILCNPIVQNDPDSTKLVQFFLENNDRYCRFTAGSTETCTTLECP